MKPPSALPEDIDDSDLDALFAQVRQPLDADAGAADRFLSRQALTLPQAPPQVRILSRRRVPWWPTLLAAAALFGGVLVLRPTPSAVLTGADTQTLASSAAYDAYSSALGSDW